MTPLPNGYVLFQPFIQSLSVDLYLVLLNLYSRDPSLERKTSFFLKVVVSVTLGFTFHNLGYILSANTKEAELQYPLLGNGSTLLSLQETPLGCSSRMPGNLNFF